MALVGPGNPFKPQPRRLTLVVRDGLDVQRDQIALLVLPPPRTSTQPQAEIRYVPAHEARMLEDLRRRLIVLDRPLVLVPSAPDGHEPAVFPMDGCRTCRHAGPAVRPGRGGRPASPDPYPDEAEHPCSKREGELQRPWNYCERHEEPEEKT